MHLEGWSTNVAFYWAIITITTVGFGDHVPTNSSAKLFCIFFIIIGYYALLSCFKSLIWNPIKMYAMKGEIKVLTQFDGDLTESQFNGIVNHPLFHNISKLRRQQNRITKAEFVLCVLNMMNKVADEDILLGSTIFDKFDTKQTGISLIVIID